MLRIIFVLLFLIISIPVDAEETRCRVFDMQPDAELMTTVRVDFVNYIIGYGNIGTSNEGGLFSYENVSYIEIWTRPNGSVLIIFLDNNNCVQSTHFKEKY